MLGFEARLARIPGEEALEGLVEVTKRLTVCDRGNGAQEGVVGIDAGDEGRLQRHPVGLPAGLIGEVPVLEGPVVSKAGAASRLAEERFLGGSRSQGDDMGE